MKPNNFIIPHPSSQVCRNMSLCYHCHCMPRISFRCTTSPCDILSSTARAPSTCLHLSLYTSGSGLGWFRLDREVWLDWSQLSWSSMLLWRCGRAKWWRPRCTDAQMGVGDRKDLDRAFGKDLYDYVPYSRDLEILRGWWNGEGRRRRRDEDVKRTRR